MAEAAARIGAGLVTVAAPAEIMPTIQSRLTEATFVPLPTTGSGSVARDALAPVLELLGRADALAIGPGLTTDDETAAFVRDLVRASPVPVVVDADGLNAFAGRTADLADRKADAILTPHAGEFARLTGLSSRGSSTLDRLGHVRAARARHRRRHAPEGEPDDRGRRARTGRGSIPRADRCWRRPGPATCSPA